MRWYAVTVVNQETQAWMYTYDVPSSYKRGLIHARIASLNPVALP